MQRSARHTIANSVLQHNLGHPLHTANALLHSLLWDQLHLTKSKDVNHLLERPLLDLRHFHTCQKHVANIARKARESVPAMQDFVLGHT